jgi:hypothetical protein
LPSFRFDRTTQTEELANRLRELREKGLRVNQSQLPADVDVYVGDLVAEGTGEVLLRHLADAR